jgi:hypothetical protein
MVLKYMDRRFCASGRPIKGTHVDTAERWHRSRPMHTDAAGAGCSPMHACLRIAQWLVKEPWRSCHICFNAQVHSVELREAAFYLRDHIGSLRNKCGRKLQTACGFPCQLWGAAGRRIEARASACSEPNIADIAASHQHHMKKGQAAQPEQCSCSAEGRTVPCVVDGEHPA